jgi:hypothetical protein
MNPFDSTLFTQYLATNQSHVTGASLTYNVQNTTGFYKATTSFDRFLVTISTGTMSGVWTVYGLPD